MQGYRKGPPHAYIQYGVGFPPPREGPKEEIVQPASEHQNYPPPHYFVFALLSIGCCIPLGIIATLYSVKTKDNIDNGEQKNATHNSRMAYKFAIMATATGIGLMVLIIGIIAVRASTECDKASWHCVEIVFGADP